MLGMALYMLVGTRYTGLSEVHPYPFWVILFSLFGGLQLIAIRFHQCMGLQQYLMALVNGSIWIWISAVEQEPVAFFVGFSNLYAFSVGFLFLKKSWLN